MAKVLDTYPSFGGCIRCGQNMCPRILYSMNKYCGVYCRCPVCLSPLQCIDLCPLCGFYKFGETCKKCERKRKCINVIVALVDSIYG